MNFIFELRLEDETFAGKFIFVGFDTLHNVTKIFFLCLED